MVSALLRKPKPTFNIPTLGDSSVEYAALVKKRDKLAAQLGKLQTEHSELIDEISREVVPQARRERDARVAALLDDDLRWRFRSRMFGCQKSTEKSPM